MIRKIVERLYQKLYPFVLDLGFLIEKRNYKEYFSEQKNMSQQIVQNSLYANETEFFQLLALLEKFKTDSTTQSKQFFFFSALICRLKFVRLQNSDKKTINFKEIIDNSIYFIILSLAITIICFFKNVKNKYVICSWIVISIMIIYVLLLVIYLILDIKEKKRDQIQCIKFLNYLEKKQKNIKNNKIGLKITNKAYLNQEDSNSQKNSTIRYFQRIRPQSNNRIKQEEQKSQQYEQKQMINIEESDPQIQSQSSKMVIEEQQDSQNN